MGQNVSRVRQVNRAVFTISGIMALALIGDSLLYSVLPIYADELGIPLVMVGAILSMNRWIRLISNPYAAKTYGQQTVFKPVFFSILGATASTALYALALGVVSFLLARGLWGFSYSFFRLGTHLVVLQTSRPVLGLAMGVTQAVSRLGSAFTVITGGVLIDLLGYQNGMLLLASLTALALPLAFLLRSQMKTVSVDQEGEDGQGENVSGNRTLSTLFCLVAALVTHVVGDGLVASSLSLLLRERIMC
ncbi:MAG: MFS transporter [Firmicutes bacterium]|nr:MFS transporter [Bacillota bacterium]